MYEHQWQLQLMHFSLADHHNGPEIEVPDETATAHRDDAFSRSGCWWC
jgi:hypothetical protein